jgi:hypothetical protein
MSEPARLPQFVTDQFAAIPLDDLMQLIDGMKAGSVFVGMDPVPVRPGDDPEAPIDPKTMHRIDDAATQALFLRWLEDELQRRRQ